MGLLQTTSASVTGPYHIARGLPNQDTAAIFESGGLTLGVASDGAGSLERSDEGSQLASSVAEATLAEVADASVDSAVHIVESARAALLELDDPEMGCTLAVFITDGNNWATAGIGDSFVVLESSAGFQAFSAPPGEYANVTELLTSRSPEIWTGEGDGFNAAAACTDGLEHSTLVNQRPHEPFWSDIFKRVVRGMKFSEVLEFMSQSERLDDDTSAAIAVRAEDTTQE